MESAGANADTTKVTPWSDATCLSWLQQIYFVPFRIGYGDSLSIGIRENGIGDGPVVYPRPRPGTRTGRVWEVADEITRETGQRASRRDVVERIVTESGNRGTANTQYQHWKTSYDATHTPVTPDEDLRNVEGQSLSVAPDGRLVIPQEMRAAMLLDKDPQVTVRVEAGELRMISRRVAIRRTQRKLRALKRPGIDEVDAFLEDRKAMWGDE